MYDANTVSYTVDSKEYCYNVDRPYYQPSSMQVYIPALMPEISMGLPKITPSISLNQSMFANDASCRPKPSSTISTQNYVTITRWANEYPSFPNKCEYEDTRIIRYSKFIVDIMNGDIRNMHISKYI